MTNNDEYIESVNCCCCAPRLGETAPDFTAVTTHGKIKLSDYNKNSWVLLFSHPADFTPVCTTEFIAFAEKQEEFDKRNVKLFGLSVDSVYSHIAWVKQIEEIFEIKIKFPIIADIPMEVSELYGMIHPEISEVHPIRAIYLIDPSGIIRTIIYYPSSVGRNIDEILRLIDAMQVVDKEGVATPVNWKPGDNVIIPPPTTVEEATKTEHSEHEECHSWYLCKRKI
jgi:peroxiredoxin (alkyl hydroperoxide reductase subunit C)